MFTTNRILTLALHGLAYLIQATNKSLTINTQHTNTYENTQTKQASKNRQANRERICYVLLHNRCRNTANCHRNHGEPMSANDITILYLRAENDKGDDAFVFAGHLTKQDLTPEIHDFVQDHIAWRANPEPEEGRDYFVHVEQSQLIHK